MPHYRIQDIAPLSPVQGVNIRAIHGDRMTMAIFLVEAGSKVPEHSHPHEQMGMVIRGVMDMTVGQEDFTVRPGEAYHVPGGVPHSGLCREYTELVEVFCPPRKELSWT